MRIDRHSRPDSDYTVIPNGALRDERLSYRARGVLAELLTPAGRVGQQCGRHGG